MAGGPADVVPRIADFIRATSGLYDAYVVGEYHSDESSMMFKQGGFLMPADKAGRTAPAILNALAEQGKPVHLVSKNTRSLFQAKKGQGEAMQAFLKENRIDELHVVGVDGNDCVLATAYGGIDRDYYTCVVEELCHIFNNDLNALRAGMVVLQTQNMTNHSIPRNVPTMTVSLDSGKARRPDAPGLSRQPS
jgi:nicotinamidase-related amidase